MKYLIIPTLFACLIPVDLVASGPKGLSSAKSTNINEITPENLTVETADDGTRFIALRLREGDAQAVRIHITGMRLSADQRLFISSGDGSQTFGPFEGAGPVQTGEFWSEAIRGSEVVVELQMASEVAPNLPFVIDGIEAADLADVPRAAEEIQEGAKSVEMYEGDILIDASHMEVSRKKDGGKLAVGITGQRYRWPNGTMPYVIEATMPNQSRVISAINHWNSAFAGTLRIIPRTTESNYVFFARTTDQSNCSSYVGYINFGLQPINVGNYCTTGNIIHEIGHAFGLWHEQSREDRDNYIKINWANIQSGQSYNFAQNIDDGDDLGAYDYNSIMHYSGTAFSANGLPTIVTIPVGIPIGQRSSLSTGDIEAIRKLYPSTSVPGPTEPPSTQPATPVTLTTVITSNPVGSTLTVDGETYTTPATFHWSPGSVHTISAVNTISNGMRRTFVNWSDGGAQSHVVTASAELSLLKADFAVAYAVATRTIGPGSVSISPASADGFYPAGTQVTLSANPGSGQCFNSWVGLIAGTPNRTAITTTRSYDLMANFQPGAITLTAVAMSIAAAGGNLTVGVNATSGCTWGVSSAVPWATVVSSQAGTGAGTVSLLIAPNPSPTARTGQISVGNKSFVIAQAGLR